MIKVSLEQGRVHKNSNLCIATEYDIGDKDIDIATAIINGRYPEKGYCVNTKVKEIIFVIEGRGAIYKENQSISFKAGDVIFIDKNEKYYWNAKCKVTMSCYPAWYPEQHIEVE